MEAAAASTDRSSVHATCTPQAKDLRRARPTETLSKAVSCIAALLPAPASFFDHTAKAIATESTIPELIRVNLRLGALRDRRRNDDKGHPVAMPPSALFGYRKAKDRS